MKELNNTVCTMITMQHWQEKIDKKLREVSEMKKILDEEQKHCDHDIVVYYGELNTHDGVINPYQCLACGTYFELGQSMDFPFCTSTIIDISDKENKFKRVRQDKFENMRDKIIEEFDENTNISIDEFCSKNKVKKMGVKY